MSQTPTYTPKQFENPFTPEQMKEFNLWSFAALQKVVKLHKWLIALLAARVLLFLLVVISAPSFGNKRLDLIIPSVYAITAFPAAVVMFLLATTLRSSLVKAVLLAALSLVPLIGVAVTLLQIRDASRKLRKIGLTVGLTGASRQDVANLSINPTYIVRADEASQPASDSPEPSEDKTNTWSPSELLVVLTRMRRNNVLLANCLLLFILIIILTPFFHNYVFLPLGSLLVVCSLWWLVNRYLLMRAMKLRLGWILIHAVVHFYRPLDLIGSFFFNARLTYILRESGFTISSILGPSRADLQRLREQAASQR
jgi:hypothetical protein